MKQDIKDKMAEIIKAQLAKTQAKSDAMKVKFEQPAPSPKSTPPAPIAQAEEISSNSLEDIMQDIEMDIEEHVVSGMVACVPVTYRGVLKLNAQAVQVETPTKVSVTRNVSKNGIEIRFDKRPSDDVLQSVRDNGFFYSRKQNMWYSKYTVGKFAFAQSL